MAKIEEHIRERRGDLLPFLDALAEDALQRSSWDELYYINAQRIVFSAKAMKVNQVLSLRQLQKDIEPRVSAEVVATTIWRKPPFLRRCICGQEC
jgi:hypothetical protein